MVVLNSNVKFTSVFERRTPNSRIEEAGIGVTISKSNGAICKTMI